jgi:predicted ATP-grasp superfamily ATP-dependent carboligase
MSRDSAVPAGRRTSTILVTDAGRGSAVAIIRALGRQGWRVIAADADPHAPGLRSRYAQARVIYPSPEIKPREFVDALHQTACEKSVDLIIPVTDAAILPLSAARARFAGVSCLALPEPAALEIVTNKLATLQLAGRVAVPTPRTALVNDEQAALEAAPALGWPVVLKPQVSRLYHNGTKVEAFTVCYAENSGQLARQMRRFAGRCPVLLQEYSPGVGYGVELLMYQGQPLMAFQHKRLREIPIYGGASAFRESVPLDQLLYDFSVRLLRALTWTGLAMVEFKVGADGPKLMEINGRVWGSLPLAVHSGVDFPCRLAELYLSGPPAGVVPLDGHYAVGVRAHNLELEMVWIASVLRGTQRYPFLPMPQRHQALSALLELLNPSYKFDILSVDDPWPALIEVLKIIGKFRHKLRETS